MNQAPVTTAISDMQTAIVASAPVSRQFDKYRRLPTVWISISSVDRWWESHSRYRSLSVLRPVVCSRHRTWGVTRKRNVFHHHGSQWHCDQHWTRCPVQYRDVSTHNCNWIVTIILLEITILTTLCPKNDTALACYNIEVN